MHLKREEFTDGVGKVIGAYSTLAPALKAWPPLWDLLPDATKERHKEIVERVKKEVVVEDVDLSSMTTIATLAKLTGSN